MKRSGPLKRKSWLASKRQSPRRAEGRITHARIKEKAVRPPTAEEADHIKRVVRLGCLVCGQPATCHHVTSDGHKRLTRSHKRVTPLCPKHHQKVFDPKASKPVSVEGLGHARFTARHGIGLLKWADDAWERRGQPDHPFWGDGVTRLRKAALAAQESKVGGDRGLDDNATHPPDQSL